MGISHIETLEKEVWHLIRHIGHFYKVGHSKYKRPGQWAQVCYYGEAFVKAIDNFLAEEEILAALAEENKTPAGARNITKETPGERVANELPPF